MNIKFEGVKKKRLEFEENINIPDIMSNFILMIKSEQNYSLDVVIEALRIIQRAIMLDLHNDFQYTSEKQNPFFIEAYQYFTIYAQTH